MIFTNGTARDTLDDDVDRWLDQAAELYLHGLIDSVGQTAYWCDIASPDHPASHQLGDAEGACAATVIAAGLVGG